MIAGGYLIVGGQRLLSLAKYDRNTGSRLWLDQSVGGGDVSATMSVLT